MAALIPPLIILLALAFPLWMLIRFIRDFQDGKVDPSELANPDASDEEA